MHSQLFIIKTKMKSKKQIIYTKMIYTNSRIVSRIRRDMINLKKCHMRAQKFIYDAMYNQFIPIYNDGNVKFFNNKCNKNIKLNQFYSKKLKDIKIEFLKRLKYGLDYKKECALKNIFHKLELNYKTFNLKSFFLNEFMVEHRNPEKYHPKNKKKDV